MCSTIFPTLESGGASTAGSCFVSSDFILFLRRLISFYFYCIYISCCLFNFFILITSSGLTFAAASSSGLESGFLFKISMQNARPSPHRSFSILLSALLINFYTMLS